MFSAQLKKQLRMFLGITKKIINKIKDRKKEKKRIFFYLKHFIKLSH